MRRRVLMRAAVAWAVSVATITAAILGVWWWRKPPTLDFADAAGQLRLVHVEAPLTYDKSLTDSFTTSWRKNVVGLRASYTGPRHSHHGLIVVSWTTPIDRDDPSSVEKACAALDTSMTRTADALHASIQDGAKVLDLCRKAAAPTGYFPDSFAFAATTMRDAGGRDAYTRVEAGQYLAAPSHARLALTVTVDQTSDRD